MYPNLYYVFKDWFGVEWKFFYFLNTFGLMVAISFLVAAWLLSLELKRKEKAGLLKPIEERFLVGKPATTSELSISGITGFVFGYKLLGLLLQNPTSIPASDYIFSSQGSFWGGFFLAGVLIYVKWKEKDKQKLKEPETRILRIWPHDRVGDIVVLGLIFGILGAKLFDNFEHWDDFIQDPIGRLFSQSGLTFYGGLIMAAIAICWYAYRKKISLKHLVDAAGPSLMIAYAIGRIGCQVSGDGDWGILNSAYVSDEYGKVKLAQPGEFDTALKKDATYYLQGRILEGNSYAFVTDRTYRTLAEVPRHAFSGPSFLPKWLFAYSYPQNVNKDGRTIPGITDDHNRVLPLPVYPTPLYETIICALLFLLLWLIRKKISTPFVMFGIYLMLNGMERFMIEMMRVNRQYSSSGISLTQAEMIAICLMVAGGLLIGWSWWKKGKNQEA